MPLGTPSWRSLMEEEPDRSASEPKKLTSEEVGAHRNGVIILATDPSRSHLRYALPVPDKVEDISDLAVQKDLGLFLRTLEWFRPLALKWMQFLPGVSRIAFGAKLLWYVDNHEEGYGLLDELLPDVKVDPKSHELEYKINRPRVLPVGTDTLRVNRISTWGVKRFALEQFDGPMRTTLTSFLAVQAELDISTAADRREPFLQEQFAEILDTLVNFSVEMAEHGDVP